jgi:hypothetical protein
MASFEFSDTTPSHGRDSSRVLLRIHEEQTITCPIAVEPGAHWFMERAGRTPSASPFIPGG